MSGFVALHREAVDHPLFKGDSARLGAWFWLVAKACWKPTKFDIGGRIVTLERGQFCCSVRELATAWGWSKSTVDRFLTRLKTETMIGTDSGTGRLIITICNYAKYQDVSDDTGTAAGTPSGTAAGQQRDIKEQGNNRTRVEEEANASPSTARGRAKIDEFPQPEWADDQVWKDFLKNRAGGKGRRSYPNTATAYAKFLADIDRLSDDEWPPGRLLAHAAAKGWAGIYDPRETQNGRSQPQPADSFRSLRGSRPNPALDMFLDAERELQAEAERQGQIPDQPPRLALPPGQPG